VASLSYGSIKTGTRQVQGPCGEVEVKIKQDQKDQKDQKDPEDSRSMTKTPMCGQATWSSHRHAQVTGFVACGKRE